MKNYNRLLYFIKKLLSPNSDVSSKRFLAIFCYTPVLIFSIFIQLPLPYIYSLIGFISVLLGLSTTEKFNNNFKNNNNKDKV